MDDFLKNKLSEYKPAFKEEYWTGISAELKKRRRRKRLVLWILSGSIIFLAIAIAWTLIHFGQKKVPSISSTEIVSTQAESIPKYENKTLSKTIDKKNNPADGSIQISTTENEDTINKLIKQQASQNVSTNQHLKVTPNRSRSLLDKSPSALQKNEPSKRSSKVAQSDINQTLIPLDKSIPRTPSSFRPSNEINNSISESKSISSKESPINSVLSRTDMPSNAGSFSLHEKIEQKITSLHNTNHPSETDKETREIDANVDARAAFPRVDPLDKLAISLVDRENIVLGLPILNHVKVILTPNDIPFMKTALQIGASVVLNTSDHLIHEHHVQLKRYTKFKNSNWYAALGLAAGRYGSTFRALDNETVSYRTFVENSISQSLVPNQLYYLSAPIEFGFALGKINAGVIISPEYLLGAHGDIVTIEEMNKVVEASGIMEPLEFSVNQETHIQKETAWLDINNVNSFNYSFGISAGCRLTRHWHISFSGHYIPNGLYSFKQTVRSYNSITGRQTNIKGGLHVAYIF